MEGLAFEKICIRHWVSLADRGKASLCKSNCWKVKSWVLPQEMMEMVALSQNFGQIDLADRQIYPEEVYFIRSENAKYV